MRITAIASVLLLGTLAAGCADQRPYAYSGSYCDEYDCDSPVAPVVQAPVYGGGHGYGGYPRYGGGGYRGGSYGGGSYGGPPPPVGYNPATCSEC